MLHTLHKFDEGKRKTPIIISNLTNDCTIAQILISNTVLMNNMPLHDSTFKMSSSVISLHLVKITYRFHGLFKIKLLKHKMINVNKILIVQRYKRFASAADVVDVPAFSRHQTGEATTSTALAYTATTQSFHCAAQSTFY